ncbi:MAG: DMT family transporter [Candidatus Cloacimonetes bacterium]|nr:DMT family transporter [Candidatus Cloacimonadota bacterium]
MNNIKKEYPLSIIYLLTILAFLFWSLAFIWVRQVYDLGFRPLTLVFIRLVIASIVLTIVTRLLGVRDRINKKDYKLIFLLAFAEPFCFFLGQSFGMLFVTPTLAAVIVSTIPLMTPILAWFFLKEKVGICQIIGLLVSFSGVLMWVIEDMNLGGRLIGIVLMFFAVLGGTFYGIILKKLADKYPSMTIAKYQNYIGASLFMPLFLIFEVKHLIGFPIAFIGIRYILLLGTLPSALSYVFLGISVRRLGVVKTNIFNNLIPVFVGLLAFFILKENFSLYKIIAMIIVIVGLFVSQLCKKTNKY